MQFNWDENKAERNLLKHGVPFEEAKTVFDDPLYVDFYDPDHSEDKERYLNRWTINPRTIVDCVIYRKGRFNTHY